MNDKVVNNTVLSVSSVGKAFQEVEHRFEVLYSVNLDVKRGEVVAVVGSSGSGKSTLLQIIGGLDAPNEGEVKIDGENIHEMKEREINKVRNEKLGFIYQFHHLLPEFTALENVMMPLLIQRVGTNEAQERASEILTAVGLGRHLSHKPAKLSGGERQRVAIARALVTNPLLVLADEPTGNLDKINAGIVFDLMMKLAKEKQIAFILVTHDEEMAKKCDRAVKLSQGILKPL